MSTTIEQLQQQLANVSDPIEKIDLMLALATQQQRADPADARKLATMALRMSRSRKDKARMARSCAILGLNEYYRSDYQKSLERYRQGLLHCEEIDDPVITARCHQGIGVTWTNIGNYTEAFNALTQAREQAESVESAEATDLLGFIQNSLGVLYTSVGDFTRATEHLFRSLEIHERSGNRTGIIFAASNIGFIYNALGDPERARIQFIRAAELAILSEDKRSETSATINLGISLQQLGKTDEALRHYQRAIDLAETIEDYAAQSFALICIAGLHNQNGWFQSGMEFATAAFEIAERTGDASQWQYLTLIGELYMGLGNREEALSTMIRALEGLRSVGDRETEYQIHKDLARYYEITGDLAEAFNHHKLYTQIREEVVGQQQQRTIAQLEMRAAIEQAEKERTAMRLERQQLEREMEHKQKELAAMALHLVEKNQFLDSLKKEMGGVLEAVDGIARPAVRGLIRQVDGNISAEDDWKAFEEQFEKVHADFIKRLSQKYPKLARTELKICALLKIQMSSKEIANILATSLKNIEIHRYRIRKKLGLTADQTFSSIFAEL